VHIRVWLLLGAAAVLAISAPAATLSLYHAESTGPDGGAAGAAQVAGFRRLSGAMPGSEASPQNQVTAGTAQLANLRDEGGLTAGPLFYTTAAEGRTYDGTQPGRLPTGPWAPGDSYTRTLVVRNTGTLDLRLTGAGASLRPGSSRRLADALQVRVSTDAAGTQVLATGNLGQFSDGALTFGSKLPLLAGGSPVTLYVHVALPLTADNSYQTLTLLADFTVRGETGPLCGVTAVASAWGFLANDSLSPTGSAVINGDVFVNGDLSTTGNGRVTGTGSATGSVSGHVGTPAPNQPAVAFPTVDWDGLAGQAQQSVDGDLHLKGSYSFTQPTIDYVGGDLILNGSDTATVSGRVLFVVAGEVDISGSATLQPANGSSAIAIWTRGDASLSGSARVGALIYTPDDLKVTGNATLTGSAVAGEMTVKGSAQLNTQAGPFLCPASGD